MTQNPHIAFSFPVPDAALANVCHLTERNRRDNGIAGGDVAPREIASVGIIGAGIMGSGIAAANLKCGLPVVLVDAASEALASGVKGVMQEVSYDEKTQRHDPDRADRLRPLLTASSTADPLTACDLIVESVVENADLKRQIFARLEPRLRPQVVLASNTSSIPIGSLAVDLHRPDRFCGLHFFNPVGTKPLVEIIRGAKTSDRTIATVVAYAKRLGKMPIVVGDGPGFLVNRLLLPYMNEALQLIGEGADIEAIDEAAVSFGMALGPLAMYDVIGLDTAFYGGRTMWDAFPQRIVVSPILPALIKAGRLGCKSGAGFFSHGQQHSTGADPELSQLIRPYIREHKTFTQDQLIARLFLPMLLEATRAMEDGIVRNVRDVDLGVIFALGFPAFRGGLLHWADTLGAARVVEMLQPLRSLGERCKPTPLLLEMAAHGRKFYRPAVPQLIESPVVGAAGQPMQNVD